MFSRSAARRTSAALTAALVAVLLVTFGGPTRAAGHRAAATGTSQAGSAAKAARTPQAVVPAKHEQAALQLDLAATPPSDAPDVRPTVAVAASESAVVHTGLDLVTPTGRAPPAL